MRPARPSLTRSVQAVDRVRADLPGAGGTCRDGALVGGTDLHPLALRPGGRSATAPSWTHRRDVRRHCLGGSRALLSACWSSQGSTDPVAVEVPRDERADLRPQCRRHERGVVLLARRRSRRCGNSGPQHLSPAVLLVEDEHRALRIDDLVPVGSPLAASSGGECRDDRHRDALRARRVDRARSFPDSAMGVVQRSAKWLAPSSGISRPMALTPGAPRGSRRFVGDRGRAAESAGFAVGALCAIGRGTHRMADEVTADRTARVERLPALLGLLGLLR